MSKDKKQRVVYDFGNWRTLPLSSIFGRAKGTIPGYGKGELTPAYAGHSYHAEPYSDDQLRLISKDWKEAVKRPPPRRIQTTILRANIMIRRKLPQDQSFRLISHTLGDQLADHLYETRVRADSRAWDRTVLEAPPR